MSDQRDPSLLGPLEGDPARTVALVLGDQLDARSATLEALDRRSDAVLMVEVADESSHPPSHRQRTILFLSAMRHFALDLQARGYRVHYLTVEHPGNSQSLDAEVRRALEDLTPERVRVTQPGDWRVARLVDEWRRDLPPDIEVLPDRHFTSDPEHFAAWARGRRQLVMEHFYREQRRRLGILIDERGKPAGGRWNFDADNRARFKTAPSPPTPYAPRPDHVTADVVRLVTRRLPDLPGRLSRFQWPVTRDQARRALKSFVAHRLALFGTYQDAMWTGEPWLYHSLLASSLNLKLLSVRECVEAVVTAGERGDAPLNAVEGFVRQLIGWREFIRGVYWSEGPDYRLRNELEHGGELPDFYWTGETEMVCLSESIGQVLDHGYGHHIQRLMVTGNFALISGIAPHRVNDWYLGMYVDGLDWVTTPNVVGMTLHADGGVVGTKPYAASGRYINRMSNYCDRCPYDPTKRADDGGERAACPFTTFYWDFLIRHRKRFAGNHRMRMVLANVTRLTGQETRRIRGQADRLRQSLGIGAVDLN
jgi:deoxyribodipyrimidine photolyase-related protein